MASRECNTVHTHTGIKSQKPVSILVRDPQRNRPHPVRGEWGAKKEREAERERKRERDF